MPQSHTADKRMAPRGRDTIHQQPHYTVELDVKQLLGLSPQILIYHRICILNETSKPPVNKTHFSI